MKISRLITVLLFALLSAAGAFAQGLTISGLVTDKSTGKPIEYATILIERSEQWAIADAEGKFTIKNVQPGKTVISVSCLGYATDSKEIVISKSIPLYKVSLSPDNLALEGAVVTAKDNSNSATTSRTIDKTALDHVQVVNVTDISSLLPGGQTQNMSLTSEQQFNLRGNSSEVGSSSFGTAVELDGVRLSNNASFTNSTSTSTSTGTSFKGTSTNNIASSNIESVEVITGVPSVEYGDMTSGVVKINTRKGKTPLTVTMSTNPRSKQISASKGFGMGNMSNGRSRGIVNASIERTKAISEQMSPYTAYDRNQLSLTYSNTLSHGLFASAPLRLSATVSGNIGGLDNSADPDKFSDTYTRNRDNSLRASTNFNWLLSKPWLTSLELNASAVYSDKLQRTNSYYHSATSATSLHATQAGYYVAGSEGLVSIPAGYWYNEMCLDDKPFTSKVTLKGVLSKGNGKVGNKIKAGVDWTLDKNFGVGEYSSDYSTAPTYRGYDFSAIPAMQNVAGYIEDNLALHFGSDSHLNLIAGLRNDNTIVSGSAYGTTSSLSPRFNGKYTVFTTKSRRDKFMRELIFKGSWGVAVKQPSFSVLYPQPSYYDINVFTSTASANNEITRAYYVMPRTIEYNSNLVWQKNHQTEIGFDTDLAGTKISLTAFYNKTLDAFNVISDYDRFSYYYTPTSAVYGISIPASDRIFSVDPQTGKVTVSDRTGANPSVELASTLRKQFITRTYEDNNDNPITRMGLEWIVDFKKIKPINTTIRLDGTYYAYKSIYTDLRAYSPSTTLGSDGSLYKYVGYYYGDDAISNGTETRNLKLNCTVTTHVPKARLIVSLKLESSLLRYSRSLSERADGSTRSYVLADRQDILSTTDASIYDGEGYTVLYPEYYVSYDDPTPQPFLERLAWAKANDKQLYADLQKLVVTSSYLYTFQKDYISPYFSANLSVTKEIGDLASISFYANNFFNNMGMVHSTKTGNYTSVSSYIPRFYYGMTLRIKLQ